MHTLEEEKLEEEKKVQQNMTLQVNSGGQSFLFFFPYF